MGSHVTLSQTVSRVGACERRWLTPLRHSRQYLNLCPLQKQKSTFMQTSPQCVSPWNQTETRNYTHAAFRRLPPADSIAIKATIGTFIAVDVRRYSVVENTDFRNQSPVTLFLPKLIFRQIGIPALRKHPFPPCTEYLPNRDTTVLYLTKPLHL